MLQIYKKKHFHLQKPLFFHLINATGHKKGDRERLKRRFLSQKNFNSSILQFFQSCVAPPLYLKAMKGTDADCSPADLANGDPEKSV